MTRHKHAQTGLVTPSPLDHWIDATLHVFAMLVHIVASTLQMTCSRTRVNATRAAPTDLPQAKTDTQPKETNPAAQHRSPIALILRDRMHIVRTAELHRAIVSKDGKGVLTTLSPSFLRKQEPRSHKGSACRPWLPALRFAPAGMTIVGSSQHSGSVNSVHAFPAKAGIQFLPEKCAQRAKPLDPRLRGGCVLLKQLATNKNAPA